MKKLIWILVFLAVLVFAYYYFDQTLMIKADDGIVLMDDFRALPKDTTDVIMIGSSHVGVNIDSELLWDEFGIAEFSLWSGMQPMWNSYYYLKEALKYQTPKLVVVDMFLCASEQEFSETQYAIKAVTSLSPGIDRISAALASFESWKLAAETVWGLPTYHDRVWELGQQDFEFAFRSPDYSFNKSDYLPNVVAPVNLLDYTKIEGTAELLEKNEQYLMKIIELCKVKKIELLLLVAPYLANETEAKRMHTIENIAEENDFGCLNYLTRFAETGLDPNSDYCDSGHLNKHGIPKLTRAFGEYLIANYDLPDRREDTNHVWHDLPDKTRTQPTYTMDQAFSGDESGRYVNTGVKLYENIYASWTLMAKLGRGETGKERVFYSNFSSEGLYTDGLLVKQIADGRLMIQFDNDNFAYFNFNGDTMNLVITKNVDTYEIYIDEVCVFNNLVLPAVTYSGSLLVGCLERGANGQKYNFSDATVYNLEYYPVLVPLSEITSWSPPELPSMPMPLGFGLDQAELLFELPEQFMGGDSGFKQGRYVDTGLHLFEEGGTRFTLMTRVSLLELGTDNVFLSCFAEEANLWRGLLLRADNSEALTLLLGQIYNLQIPFTLGKDLCLAIVKDGRFYTVYADGVKLLDRQEIDCDSYMGRLLIGCEEMSDGTLFRQSATRVKSLSVFSGVVPEDEILAWSYQNAPLPPERIATSVRYELAKAFMGDGEERYIDTGVCLFDVPTKDWTLDTQIALDYTATYAVFMSCFSEEPYQYRGFMIRQEGASQLSIYVGQLESASILYDKTDKSLHLVITKRGDEYGIFCDGKLIKKLVSPMTLWEGNLLLGCQESVEGERFRFSNAKIDTLTITDGALSDEEAAKRSIKAIPRF